MAEFAKPVKRDLCESLRKTRNSTKIPESVSSHHEVELCQVSRTSVLPPTDPDLYFTARNANCPCFDGGVRFMAADPWSRPTLGDLRRILESIEPCDETHNREAERIELSVPAEIITQRGNTISAMTREISRTGIGLLHKGSVTPGDVRIKLASDTREFEYTVCIEWCQPCEEGMFLSGGRFVAKLT